MIEQNRARIIPPMPRVGEPEYYYAQHARQAEKAANVFARDAAKVGQYITLGISPSLDWPHKVRYFEHALARHTKPPPFPDDDVWLFYGNLKNLIRTHAGREALRLADETDERLAKKLASGMSRDLVDEEADSFFCALIPSQQPEWLTEADYQRLKIIRDQWI
jgi:hypothetical protein